MSDKKIPKRMGRKRPKRVAMDYRESSFAMMNRMWSQGSKNG